MGESGPIRLVVLQPTSRCNLDCRYCYVSGRTDKALMDEATLVAAATAIFGSAMVRDEVELLWHAGEPLLAGFDFYKRAFELVAAHRTEGLRVRHSIQTNATLITPRWAKLFGAHGVNVGVSLDGPAFLHDAQRPTRSHRTTHVATVKGINVLQAAGISVGALCVLTRESLAHPDEIYEEFVRLGIRSVGFNVEEVEGANKRSSLSADQLSAMRSFFLRLWQRWQQEPELLEIREFDRTLRVFNAAREDIEWQRIPDESVGFRIVTITKTGDVSTFSPELAGVASFRLGNVHQNSLDELADSTAYASQRTAVQAGKALCAKTCGYFRLCGAGYVSNKYFEHGTVSAAETVTCRLHRQVLIDSMFDALEAQASPLSAEEFYGG